MYQLSVCLRVSAFQHVRRQTHSRCLWAITDMCLTCDRHVMPHPCCDLIVWMTACSLWHKEDARTHTHIHGKHHSKCVCVWGNALCGLVCHQTSPQQDRRQQRCHSGQMANPLTSERSTQPGVRHFPCKNCDLIKNKLDRRLCAHTWNLTHAHKHFGDGWN